MRSFGFSHCAQSLRIVDVLENDGDPDGDDIFVDCVIPKIEITVEGDEMKKLRAQLQKLVK